MTSPTRFGTSLPGAALLVTLLFAHSAAAEDPAPGQPDAPNEAVAASAPAVAIEGDAQPAAPFTIRESRATDPQFHSDPETGDIAMIGYTLDSLLAQAYAVHPKDIVAPEINLSKRFDVRLRTGEKGELDPRKMLYVGVPRALQLTAEARVREGPINRLRPAKDAPQLQPSTSEVSSVRVLENRLEVTRLPIAELVAFLRWRSPRPIVDESGLDATYDFVLEWDDSAGTAALFHSLHDIGLEIFPDEGKYDVLQVLPAK